jgi:hypothetical protein
MKKKYKREIEMFIPLILSSFALLFLIFLMFSFQGAKTSEDELSKYIRSKEFIVFDENFHEEEKADITYRWLSKNATITLVIPYDQIVKIQFISWSYNIPRNVKVYLDDYLLTELNLTKERTNYASPFLYLKRGLYKLKFLISKECQIPALVENTADTRCLSIGLGEFKKIEASNLAPYIDTPGWNELESYYGKDMRWMKNEGIIKLVNLEKGDFVLSFFAFSFYFDRELNVYVDDKLVHSSKITPDGNNVEIKMNLVPGLHVIKLDAAGCDSPSKLGISADRRCLSLAIVKPIIYEV